MHPTIRRRATALFATALMILAACGGGDDGGTAAPGTTTAPTTPGDAAPTTTAASGDAAPTTTAAAGTAEPAAPSAPECAGLDSPEGATSAVDVELVEWAINAPATLDAGKVAFTISNPSNGSHELVVIRGDSYDALPKRANGAVDEDALPAGALVGRTNRLNRNQSCAAGFDLEPGSYVLICNISSGPNSHAARGQTLDITVS